MSSRTREHAIVLAEELGGVARRFEDLRLLVRDADIIVSGTASPHYVITPDMFDGSQRDKLLILDIAIPRDVDPACGQVDGVIIRNLDDIGAEIAANKDNRSVAAEQARAIVDEETQKFMDWSAAYAVTPIIKATPPRWCAPCTRALTCSTVCCPRARAAWARRFPAKAA